MGVARDRLGAWVLVAALLGAACGTSSAPKSAATTTVASTSSEQPAPSTTTLPATTTTASTAALDAYCAGLRPASFPDLQLFDDPMRPLLTRMVRARGMRVTDASLAAESAALLRTETTAASPAALSLVPVAIRADVRSLRVEKHAIVQHLVAAAGGDDAGFQFIVNAESTGGGVVAQLTRITTFVRAHCPAGDLPTKAP